VAFRVQVNTPTARIVLLKDGQAIATVDGSWLERVEDPASGAYRVEVFLPGAPGQPAVPWLVTNPIYVRAQDIRPSIDLPTTPVTVTSRYDNGEAADWAVESSPRSQAAYDVVGTLTGTQLQLRFALGGTLSESPYAALVMPAGADLSEYDRLLFNARAMQPMRISVQLRVPDGGDGTRWRKSIYLDEMPREITIAFDQMKPSGTTDALEPRLREVRDVLFVVDTVNTRPGTSGQVWIDEVRYAR
jgi:hypothetical protein